MKKFILLLVFLISVSMADGAGRKGHFFKSLKSLDVTAENVEQHFSEWFTLPAGTAWRLMGERTDRLGMTRMEYRQYVGGVEVEHSQVLLHVKDGKVMTANGTVMEADRMPAHTRSYSPHYKAGTPTGILGEKLYLVDTEEGYRYATKVLSADCKEWIYSDADTGETLKRIPLRQNLTAEPVKATGHGIFSGDVELDVTYNSESGTYYLHDQQRGIHTLVGALLPSWNEIKDDLTFLANFPGETLPAAEEYMTDDLWMEWMASFNPSSCDYSEYIRRNGQYADSKSPEFDSYIFKKVIFQKLTAEDEDGNLVEVVPTAENPVNICIEICYGTTDGMIEQITAAAVKMPITLTLTGYHDELPAAGATISVYALVDETAANEEENEEEDEDDAPGRLLLASLFLEPDETGEKVWASERVQATATYEKGEWSAVDIHWGMARTYDFYREVFNRNSFDDQGAPIYNFFYLPDQQRGQDYFIETEMNNAAAIPSKTPVMVYGMGNRDGIQAMKPCVELSVMSHEFSHLVTDATAKLEYIGESGALNESFSDIMGVSVKKYVYGNDASWAIGEGQMTYASLMRDMAHPKLGLDGYTPAPDTYEGEYWADPQQTDDDDNGGVHTNSGVQNKWYFLLSDGAEGTNDKGYSYSVTGIGIEKARQIAYRTLTEYATEQSQYADIRLCSVQAAKDLYGDDSDEVKAVAQAWNAVGVYDEDDPATGIASMSADDVKSQSVIYDLQGRPVNTAQRGIYIRGGRKFIRK